MSESLADGPDSLRTNGAAPQLTNSIDAVLEDKELMKMHVDLQKRFPNSSTKNNSMLAKQENWLESNCA